MPSWNWKRIVEFEMDRWHWRDIHQLLVEPCTGQGSTAPSIWEVELHIWKHPIQTTTPLPNVNIEEQNTKWKCSIVVPQDYLVVLKRHSKISLEKQCCQKCQLGYENRMCEQTTRTVKKSNHQDIIDIIQSSSCDLENGKQDNVKSRQLWCGHILPICIATYIATYTSPAKYTRAPSSNAIMMWAHTTNMHCHIYSHIHITCKIHQSTKFKLIQHAERTSNHLFTGEGAAV